MATNNKTSALVDSLLPSFLDEDGEKFQAFVRAYYEWMETTNQVTDRSKNLLTYQDIDNTADEFLKYFKREILSSFPDSILGDKSLVYKRIKDLYRAKGSEQAYKLLFRILYDEEIEFYYPGNDILRASDGVWVQETTIRLSQPFVGNPENLTSLTVTGLTSGATAIVDRVTSTSEQGVPVFELFLSEIEGTFEDSETVQNSDGSISGVIVASVGPLKGVIISFGGDQHQLGDGVNITSAVGSSANGTVTRTVDNSLNVFLANGGSGYIVGTPLTIVGGGGAGATFRVSAISNTETLQIYDDVISDIKDTVISANNYATSNTGAVSANLAIANSSTVLSAGLGTSNVTAGTISGITFTSRGSNYTSLPDVTARYDAVADQDIPDGFGGIKGFNAVFTPERVAGSIAEISINNPGSAYSRSSLVTLTNITRANTNPAIGAPLVTGVITYPGGYQDTRGFLSWNNKLQDNYYYQEFSYVIKSSRAIDVYRELVTNSVHPAGTKLFGETEISANIFVTFSADPFVNLSIENLQSIESTESFGIPNVVQIISPSSITSGESIGILELEFQIDPQSVTTTLSISTDTDWEMNIGDGALIGIDSTLSFGTLISEFQVDPSSITTTEALGTPEVEFQIDPVSITTTVAFETDLDYEFNIGSGVLIGIDSTLQFGTLLTEFQVDPSSIASTANVVGIEGSSRSFDLGGTIASSEIVSTDSIIDMNLGGATLISISPSLSMSTDNAIYNVGTGTLTNQLVDDAQDLENKFISDYQNLTINTFPSNRVFDGVGTLFTTELEVGDTLLITDVNDTGAEITVTVDSISDANTLVTTANATFANGDLAIISSGTYLFNNS